MSTYKMTAQEVMMTSGSSKGTQIKFLEDGYWYKLNEKGYEDKAETLASLVLSCSNLPPSQYVSYESCVVEYEGKAYAACRSPSFLQPTEQYISYDRLYKMYNGSDLNSAIIPLNSPSDRIRYTEDFVLEYTGLQVHDYISNTLSLDMLTLNIDRHFNNMGLIADQTHNVFRSAPIFDNGAALLSNVTMFPNGIPFSELGIYSKPFSANFEYQASSAGITLRVDYARLEKHLQNEPPSRALDILHRQMERYQKLLNKTIPDHIVALDTAKTLVTKYLAQIDLLSDTSPEVCRRYHDAISSLRSAIQSGDVVNQLPSMQESKNPVLRDAAQTIYKTATEGPSVNGRTITIE